MNSELYLALGHFKCANYSILNRKLTLFSIIPRSACIIFNTVWNTYSMYSVWNTYYIILILFGIHIPKLFILEYASVFCKE